MNRTGPETPPEPQRHHCRAIILSAGREVMAYRADFSTLRTDTATGHATILTWHTRTRIIAPLASMVLILEPEDEAGQIDFQERDQLYP